MNKLSAEQPTIHENCKIINCEFGSYTEVGEASYLENVEMGDYSYNMQFSIIQNTIIGKFANIAAMTRIGPTFHPVSRATLHHFTYRRRLFGMDERDDELFFEQRCSRKTYIGHDTWLGHGAIIMPGITIGDGAVIGSGAIVTKSIPDYTIAAGNPARVIKRRFDKKVSEQLKQIEWWNWSYETIKLRLEDFSLPIDEFIDKYL